MILLLVIFAALRPAPPQLAVTAIDGVSQVCEVIGTKSCGVLYCNCGMVVE